MEMYKLLTCDETQETLNCLMLELYALLSSIYFGLLFVNN